VNGGCRTLQPDNASLANGAPYGNRTRLSSVKG
jgi:hypothetical protein